MTTYAEGNEESAQSDFAVTADGEGIKAAFFGVAGEHAKKTTAAEAEREPVSSRRGCSSSPPAPEAYVLG